MFYVRKLESVDRIELPEALKRIIATPSKIYAGKKEIKTLEELKEHAGEYLLEVFPDGKVNLLLVDIDGKTVLCSSASVHFDWQGAITKEKMEWLKREGEKLGKVLEKKLWKI